MFIWYHYSALAVIYLSDVPPSSNSGALANSIWNTRGWTVQEFCSSVRLLYHQPHTLNHCSKEPCLEDLYICPYTPTLSALVPHLPRRPTTACKTDPNSRSLYHLPPASLPSLNCCERLSVQSVCTTRRPLSIKVMPQEEAESSMSTRWGEAPLSALLRVTPNPLEQRTVFIHIVVDLGSVVKKLSQTWFEREPDLPNMFGDVQSKFGVRVIWLKNRTEPDFGSTITITTPLQWFKGHERHISAVTDFPDKCRMVTGSYNTTLCLWDLKTGVSLKEMEGHHNWVSRLVVSRDGQLIASSDNSGKVIVWLVGIGGGCGV
ncbi:hypothetical protein EV424DRAFT_1589850 [Suillus variegatus]|nr:hypothetical protein EV424DRAFT_1589850 [Suillus variegatus]